jgi:hypothetical protein
MKIPILNSARKALLSEYSSKQNKLHLITGWTYFKNWYIEWKWAGDPYKSRMLFKFSPDDKWIEAKSFEEDLLPTYKFEKEHK